MKIDTKEITKINDALESIEDWVVEDFKVWEKKNGEGMATIRLRNKKEETKEEQIHETEVGVPGTAGIDINISSDYD